MDEFKIKFRGVRGSFPVCDRNFMKFGGNTSCVELNVGPHVIILDAGTGIVKTGDELMENYILSSVNPEERKPVNAIILVSHIHQDHLLGLTFFKPLHLKSANIKIFGDGTVDKTFSQNLSELVFGKTFPLDLGDIACNLEVCDIKGQNGIVIKPDGQVQTVVCDNFIPNEDDVYITFYKSFVHPQDGVMIYKISYKNKSVVYSTDKECYMGGDKKFGQFAAGCDVLIHDAQYTTEDYLSPISPKQGFGHSTYDMAIEVMKQSNAKKLVFFHYEPSYDDNKLSSIKEYYNSECKNAEMSYEGMEINLI